MILNFLTALVSVQNSPLVNLVSLIDHPSVVQSNQTDHDNNPSISEPKKPTLTIDDQNIIFYQRRRGKQKETEV